MPRERANIKFTQLGIPLKKKTADSSMIYFSTMRGGDIEDINNEKDISSKTKIKAAEWGISSSLFLTYLTVMAAKCALPSTLSMLTAPNSGLAHHNIVLSRQDVMSRLLALSTVSIALGKLLLGPIIDSLGGILSLQIALSTLFICLCSIGIGTQTCPTLIAFAIYWIIIDFGFSACWAACVKTIRDYLPEENWAREIGRLAMAARLGNAISFTCFASLLHWASTRSITQSIGHNAIQEVDASWRWVFRASSMIQLIPLYMLSYFGRKSRTSDNKITIGESKQQKNETIHKSTLIESLSILRQQAKTPEFWLHLISRSMIMVLVSFLLFIPSYMAQCFEMSSAASARVGSMFALGCLLSVSTLAEKAYPSVATDTCQSKLIYRRKAYSMLAFMSTATLCLVVQTAFLKNMINLTPAIGTFLMFLFGFSLGESISLTSTFMYNHNTTYTQAFCILI